MELLPAERDTVTWVHDWARHVNHHAALFAVFVNRLIPSYDKDAQNIPHLVECMQEACTRLRRFARVVTCLTTAMLQPVNEVDMSTFFTTTASLRETTPGLLEAYNDCVLSMRSWCLPHEREVFLQEDLRTYRDKFDQLEAVMLAMQRRF